MVRRAARMAHDPNPTILGAIALLQWYCASQSSIELLNAFLQVHPLTRTIKHHAQTLDVGFSFYFGLLSQKHEEQEDSTSIRTTMGTDSTTTMSNNEARYFRNIDGVRSDEWGLDPLMLARDLHDRRSCSNYELDASPPAGMVSGSLYTGSLGLAYLSFEVAHFMPNEKVYCLKDAKTSVELLLENIHSERQRVTLLQSTWVGAKCLLAAICYNLDDDDDDENNKKQANYYALEVIEKLGHACSQLDEDECDVLYGRAGVLQAIWFLRRQLEDPSLGERLAVRLSKEILKEGLRKAKEAQSSAKLPLLWQWHEKLYLGAAHGVVGILHTLLQLREEEWQQIEEQDELFHIRTKIQDTIEGLTRDCCFPSGNLHSSLGSTGSDRLVQFCHGAPGHCLLLLKAAEIFQNNSFKEQAKTIAEQVIWPRGLLTKGVGLCHGISGNALVFLALARTSSSSNDRDYWQQMAIHYARFAADHLSELEQVPDRPYSLYEGLGGFIYLLLCLQHPDEARFPLYE
jgi:lantibiotic modifying enzyme